MYTRRRRLTTSSWKIYPKSLDKIECKHVDESIRSEFFNCFPFGNKHVEGVKVLMDKFLPPLGRIVYPLSNTHKNEIKHQILMFHYIDKYCPMFAIHSDLNNPTKILEMRLRNRSIVSSSMFFYYGWTTYNPGRECNSHIIVSCCWFFANYSSRLTQFL